MYVHIHACLHKLCTMVLLHYIVSNTVVIGPIHSHWMAGWHPWLYGHDFVQAPGVGDGQRSLVAAVHGVAKSRTRLCDWTESLIHTFSYPLTNLYTYLHIFIAYFHIHIPVHILRKQYFELMCTEYMWDVVNIKKDKTE